MSKTWLEVLRYIFIIRVFFKYWRINSRIGLVTSPWIWSAVLIRFEVLDKTQPCDLVGGTGYNLPTLSRLRCPPPQRLPALPMLGCILLAPRASRLAGLASMYSFCLTQILLRQIWKWSLNKFYCVAQLYLSREGPSKLPPSQTPPTPLPHLLAMGLPSTFAYYFAQTMSLRKAPFILEMDLAGVYINFRKVCERSHFGCNFPSLK